MNFDPSWLNSITAATVAAFTMYKATVELGRWRTERRVVKQADVAGEALVASLQLLMELRDATTEAIRRDDKDDNPGDEHEVRFRNVVAARWVRMEPTLARFREARIKAELLPDDASKVLERIAELQHSISYSQEAWIEAPANRKPPPEVNQAGFGGGVRKELDALRDETRRVLRRYAQFR